MQFIRDILRLHFQCDLSRNKIAKCLKMSSSSVGKYLKMSREAGFQNYEDVKAFKDSELKELLGIKPRGAKDREAPNWMYIHQERQKKGINLLMLYEEFCDNSENPISRTRFYVHYKNWAKKHNLSMVQNYEPGEVLFEDYAGDTVEITDSETGQKTEVQAFVAALGFSQYPFVDFTLSQTKEDFIESNIRCFEFMGGVADYLVPDNLKSCVTKACIYDPVRNKSFTEMADHYGVAVIPARSRKPKDKSIAENAVNLVQQRVLPILRRRDFFSLDELRREGLRLLMEVAGRPFQKKDGSRISMFNEEKKALKPLPPKRHEMAEFRNAKVHIDYHIELEKKFYSVPYRYVGEEVIVRYTRSTVEIFHDNSRITSHSRFFKGRYNTNPEHMPKAHSEQVKWPPERLVSWAKSEGENVGDLVEKVLHRHKCVQHGYRPALGIIRLAGKYPSERLDKACKKALDFDAWNYRFVRQVLESGVEDLSEQKPVENSIGHHKNIRGKDHYKKQLQADHRR